MFSLRCGLPCGSCWLLPTERKCGSQLVTPGLHCCRMPFRSPGAGAKQEQLGKTAICQSNQITSNPRAGLLLLLAHPSQRPWDRLMHPVDSPCTCREFSSAEMLQEAWTLGENQLPYKDESEALPTETDPISNLDRASHPTCRRS